MEKIKKHILNNKLNLLIIALIFLLVTISIIVFTGCFYQIDYNIVKFFKINRIEWITTTMLLITELCNWEFVLFLAIVLIISFRKKIMSIFILINSLGIFIFNQLLKIIIQRNRPSGTMLFYESGFSCPSGHAMISIVIYGFIIYLINKFMENRLIKRLLSILLIIIIILIGFSRIYLGVHYISDILIGWLVGMLFLLIEYKYIISEKTNKK